MNNAAITWEDNIITKQTNKQNNPGDIGKYCPKQILEYISYGTTVIAHGSVHNNKLSLFLLIIDSTHTKIKIASCLHAS